MTRFNPGDWVIYRKQKFSVRPGPHAKEIRPAEHGDLYAYEVDKFWIVLAIEGENELIIGTRRGKRVSVRADDPALRHARWLERLFFRHRFPAQAAGDLPPAEGSSAR